MVNEKYICSIYLDDVLIGSLSYSYLYEYVTARDNVLFFYNSHYWTVSSFKEYKNFRDLGYGSSLYL